MNRASLSGTKSRFTPELCYSNALPVYCEKRKGGTIVSVVRKENKDNMRNKTMKASLLPAALFLSFVARSHSKDSDHLQMSHL